MFCCIADLSFLVWQRAKDIRTSTEFQTGATSIHFVPSKTARSSGRSVEIELTPAIREVIEQARTIKAFRGITSTYPFATRQGTAYTKSGLNSRWIRARARTKIDGPIQ